METKAKPTLKLLVGAWYLLKHVMQFGNPTAGGYRTVAGGTPMSLFPQYVDPDFLPGEGVPEWLDDQRQTLALGAKWSAETGRPLEVEFDARFARYEDTIGALEKSAMWTINTFNDVAAKLD